MVRRLPVKETIAGSIPAAAALRKGKPTGDGSRPENGRAMSLEGSTPSPSAFCALGRAAKALVFQTSKVGSIPTGHSRGSANGRPAVFEAAHEGSTPSPRTWRYGAASRQQRFRGRLTGRTSGSEPADVGSTPAPGTYFLIPWSSGEDSWPTSRQRWFESIRDQWSAGVASTPP
jgi:hypothetical protein